MFQQRVYAVLDISDFSSSSSLTAVAHEPEGPREYFTHYILHHFWLAAFLCRLEGGAI